MTRVKYRQIEVLRNHWLIASRRYQQIKHQTIHSATKSNDLVIEKKIEWLTNAQTTKRSRGEPTIINQLSASKHNIDVQQFINKSQYGKNIHQIIKQNHRKIDHASIFGKAMSKCQQLRDWKSVHEIMDLLLSSNIKPDRIQFSIFFNSMAKSDSPEICIKYFHLMVNIYRITPDYITFSSVLKSFRMQGRYLEAEKCWDVMTKTFNITPNDLIYTEMLSIYAKAHQKERASRLFDEYLVLVNNKQIPSKLPTFDAYLNVFSECGDVNGMLHAVGLIKKYGHKVDVIVFTNIIKCCYAAREYDTCLKVFRNWINKGNSPIIATYILICAALQHMIRSDGRTFKERYELYTQLEDIVNQQLKCNGSNVPHKLVKAQLSGAMFLYYDNNPIKIVEIFETFLERKLIGYQQTIFNNQTVIDLHLFEPWIVQFIIRYLIGFKLDVLLEECLYNDQLIIITGKGKHHEGEGNNKAWLKSFLIDELSKWNPPIKCKQISENEGRISIDKKELIPYLNNDTNYAKQKLTIPSNDWFYDDPRDKSSMSTIF